MVLGPAPYPCPASPSGGEVSYCTDTSSPRLAAPCLPIADQRCVGEPSESKRTTPLSPAETLNPQRAELTAKWFFMAQEQ